MIGFNDTRGERGPPAKMTFIGYGEEIQQLVQSKLVNSNAVSFYSVVKNYVQSRLVNSAVFCSAAVVGEEALGEDTQQSLHPIVSYSVQYNQQYDCTLVVLHAYFHCLRGRGDDGMGCQ